MFEEQELAPRPEDTVYLAKGLVDSLDAAQSKRTHHGIEAAGVKGQMFAVKTSLIDLDSRQPDPALRQPVHSSVGLDRRDFVYPGRVVGEVEASSEADLENVALDVGKQIAPLSCNR
jgi:hypothetical protein